MNAAFVAEARRVYIPAMRWLKANGWGWHQGGGFRNQDRRLSLEWNDCSDRRGGTPYITVNTRSEYGTLLRCPLMADVASITEAVDHLVVAGVLPAKFASWTRPPVDASSCPRCKHSISGHHESGCAACDCGMPLKYAQWAARKLAEKASASVAA